MLILRSNRDWNSHHSLIDDLIGGVSGITLRVRNSLGDTLAMDDEAAQPHGATPRSLAVLKKRRKPAQQE